MDTTTLLVIVLVVLAARRRRILLQTSSVTRTIPVRLQAPGARPALRATFRRVSVEPTPSRQQESGPRQVNGEDASSVRQVARIDPAMVRFDAPPAEGEAEAQARSIGASLLERAEQIVDVPVRETAAFVLDLDQHPLGTGADPQRDGGPRPGELECVLQEVHHHRREDLPVSLDDHSIVDRHHASARCRGRVPPMVAAGASSSMNPDTRNCSRF